MRNVICSIILFFLTGCTAYPVYEMEDNQPKATFSLESSNDTGTTTTRRVDVLILKDIECNQFESGVVLAYDFENSQKHYIAPTKIPSGEKIYLSVIYGDSRWSGQNKVCNSTVGFSPEEGTHYKGVFIVKDDATRCAVKVFGESNGGIEVPLEIPKGACTAVGKAKYKNGQPLIINWEFRVAN